MKSISLCFLLILCLFFTMLVPLAFFEIQDTLSLRTQRLTQSSQLAQLNQNHPIIAQLYAQSYEQYDQTTTYDITSLDSYEDELKDALIQQRTQIEQQVNACIEQGVLDPFFLQQAIPFSLSYGSMSDPLAETSFTANVTLTQSIEQSYVRSQSFTLLKQANKIIQIELSNEYVAHISNAQCQEIASQMIQYLGLSDIDDWNYIDNSFESYQAKLRVYCMIQESDQGYPRLRIGIQPLHLDLSPHVNIMIDPTE